MKKSPCSTLQQLHACLREQTREIATLRAELDLQATRITHLQAEREGSWRRGVSGGVGPSPLGKPH